MIGIAGAIGAFGGFLIQVVLRQASLGVSALVKAAETPAEKVAVAQANADWSVPALWVFLGSYVVFAGMTWFFYLRRSVAHGAGPEPRVRVGLRHARPRARRGRSSARAGRSAARRPRRAARPGAVGSPAPRRSCRRRSERSSASSRSSRSVGSSTGATSSTRVSRLRGMRSAEPISTDVLVAALEREDPRVLEEAPDDRDDADVLADALDARPQAADAADVEVDRHAGLRRAVQRADAAPVDERVHLHRDPRRLAVARARRSSARSRSRIPSRRCVGATSTLR